MINLLGFWYIIQEIKFKKYSLTFLIFKTKAHYLSIARQIKAYEDMKYNEWKLTVENTLPEILKTNLLIKPKDRVDQNLILPANSDPETGTSHILSYLIF